VRLATRMALLSKFIDEQVTLLNELSIAEPKTKAIAGMLKSLGLSKTSCLLAIEAHDGKAWRSGRNIPTLQISSSDDLNAYDLLHQRQLILTRGALERLRKGSKKPAAAKG
jgi:large subunit ribosomal protein L4